LRRRRKLLLTIIAVLACGVFCLAKSSKLTGRIVAYDVMRHGAKDASFVQNEEVIVMEVTAPRQRYVKIVFSSFGTTQIDQKYFDGAQALDVDVFRDKACDETTPRFISEMSPQQVAGTYLLTDAFKKQSPNIKKLECYDAIFKKKK
jgi:hypothetical protein